MRATAIGSVSKALLLDVEDEADGADHDLVAGAETRGVDLAPVDLDSVGRPEIDDLPIAGRSAAQLRVAPGDVRVGKPEPGGRAVIASKDASDGVGGVDDAR